MFIRVSETHQLGNLMKIDVGLSLRICRVKYGVSNIEIAEALGVVPQYASLVANRTHSNTRTVETLAALFGLKPSEFIAIGEE